MIEELNQQLKSMYLEPRSKLRVDVDYVVNRIESMVNVATDYEIESESQVNGYGYLMKDIEDFLNELKQNMENHNGN